MPGAQSPFQRLLGEVKPHVDLTLARVWEEAYAEHAGLGSAVAQPLAAARDLCLRGGKRLRAALVALGYRLGGGGEDWARVLPACCAVELLQAYFLIHDDWMDQDRSRRGGPAVHAALEAQLGSAHLAASGAVLAGDYALGLATRMLAAGTWPAERMPRALHRFAVMQLDAVVGQQLDVLGDGSNLDDVYRLKTGSYTVFGPLELGRVLGGGAGPDRALEAFAAPVGIAFQLRDDLIGAFSDSASSGKPRGSDLRSGKRTLLLRLALQLASPAGLAQISAVVGNAAADEGALRNAIEAVDASGARARVEERIAALTAEARAVLGGGAYDEQSRALLEGVLSSLLDRVG